MGRRGRILSPRNCFLLFVCFFFACCAAVRRRFARRGQTAVRGNSGVQNIPSRSERAGQHSRECVSVRCGLRRHDAVAQGGLRWRCGGRRMRIAAAPVLPDGGRPVGTAWKDFESGVSSPVLPPAARRCTASLRLPRRICSPRARYCGIATQGNLRCLSFSFPLSQRAGQRRRRVLTLLVSATFEEQHGLCGGAACRENRRSM